jgi:hypothetical protein
MPLTTPLAGLKVTGPLDISGNNAKPHQPSPVSGDQYAAKSPTAVALPPGLSIGAPLALAASKTEKADLPPLPPDLTEPTKTTAAMLLNRAGANVIQPTVEQEKAMRAAVNSTGPDLTEPTTTTAS